MLVNDKLIARKLMAGLALCYIGCVLIRFLLALFTSSYPMINIDEFLYYGIARSLSNGEGILFRGQPANFSYLLYSLVLLPVYWLGFEGPMLYRALQLWNILLGSISVFPLFFLANRLVKSKEKSIKLVCVAMLLPDFMLGQLMMAENVLLPLFYTLMAVAARYSGIGNEKDGNRWQDVIWTGILGGLLFAGKPGAIIPAVVLLVAWSINGIFSHNKAQTLWPLCGLGIAAAVGGLFFLIVSLLGGIPSLLSIYEVQVANVQNLDVFTAFLFIYPIYFFLACGVGMLVIIMANRKQYSISQKNTSFP